MSIENFKGFKIETEMDKNAESDTSSIDFDSDVESEEVFDNLLLVKIEQI